jgi:uncharacterized Zn finger protein
MYFRWTRYVPAAARRKKSERTVVKLQRNGRTLAPVTAGRGAIAKSFWGKAWCTNLERYSDYSNRLPRGRTYLRNGSVIDLQIGTGVVRALVSGSSLYRISLRIAEVAATHWQSIARDCARSIDSLVELLQGRLSSAVMERITRPGTGLFPSPEEISFSCSCPDSAAMCKHIAATLYGIGARLDTQPELLFGVRRVDAKDLIALAGDGAAPTHKRPGAGRILDSSKLADVFGIDLAGANPELLHKSAAEGRKSSAPRKAKAATRLGARPARKKPRNAQ